MVATCLVHSEVTDTLRTHCTYNHAQSYDDAGRLTSTLLHRRRAIKRDAKRLSSLAVVPQDLIRHRSLH